MALHAQGLSAREIGAIVGKTRNAVIGYIWKYKKRGGPSRRQPPVSRYDMISAMESSGGNLRAAARLLNVPYCRLYAAGFKGGSGTKVNSAADPFTHELVGEINKSGLSDSEIALRVDMSATTIRNWRHGRHRAGDFLAQCVRTVLKQNTPGY